MSEPLTIQQRVELLMENLHLYASWRGVGISVRVEAARDFRTLLTAQFEEAIREAKEGERGDE